MTRLGLVFPGQGSQHIGMGKYMYEASASARQYFEEASDILRLDMAKLCFEGPMRELSRPDLMQAALVTVCMASFAVYQEQVGIEPDFAAGHSLGEYSALVSSQAIRFADAVRLVQHRGQLALLAIDREVGHMMVVQELEEEELLRLCSRISSEGQLVAPACLNAPRQTMVAGTAQAISQLEEELWKLDAKTTPLFTSPPFHTLLMEEEANKLKQALDTIAYEPFRFPVLSGVTALPYRSERDIAAGLAEQLVKPIQWRRMLDYAESRQVDLVVELGPQSVLCALARENNKSFPSYSYGSTEERNKLRQRLAEMPERGNVLEREYHIVERCMGIAMSVKNENADLEAYEQGVIVPYERLEQLCDEIDSSMQPPSDEQLRTAMELLAVILETKHVPLEDREHIYADLLEETGVRHIVGEGYDAQPELTRIARSS